MRSKRCTCDQYPKTIVTGNRVATRCDDVSHREPPRTRWIVGTKEDTIRMWNKGELHEYASSKEDTAQQKPPVPPAPVRKGTGGTKKRRKKRTKAGGS